MRKRENKRRRKTGCLTKIIATIGLCIMLINQIKWPNFNFLSFPWLWGKQESEETKKGKEESVEELFPELEIPSTNIENNLEEQEDSNSYDETIGFTDSPSKKVNETTINTSQPVANLYEEMKIEKPKNTIKVDVDLTSGLTSYSPEEVNKIIDKVIEETLQSATILLEQSKSETMTPDETDNTDLTTNNQEERIFPDREELIINPKKAILLALKEAFINVFKPVSEVDKSFAYEDKKVSTQYEEPELLPFTYEDNNTLKR